MKSVSRPAVFIAFLLAIAVTPLLLAQNNGPAANGDFVFTTGSMAKSLTFDARIQNNGNTHGSMVMIGADDFGDQDVDGGGDTNPGGAHSNVSMTVGFDCLRIVGNRAIMAGPITDSSVPAFIGVRALLVVEDGGEGKNAGPDKFTWGLYRGGSLTWVPTDAELLSDPGVGLTWLASDSENLDDVPIPMGNPNGTPPVNCTSFSLPAYDLGSLALGAGNVQVKP